MRKILLLIIITLGSIRKQTIKCENNQAPRFYPSLQSNYFFPEFNSTKPGDVLLWLNATDPDDDTLEFGVLTENGATGVVEVRQVEPKRAVVLCGHQQPFDREVQEKYENIVFFVRDPPGNKVYQSVRFVVLDIDDNVPVFRNAPYRVDVSEHTPTHSVLIRDGIEAVDADGPLYNKFSFSLANDGGGGGDHDSGLFGLAESATFVSSGHYSTSLVLLGALDYESAKVHVLTVQTVSSESGAVQTSAQLVVNVLDAPDRRPEFAQSHYYVKIEEEMAQGKMIKKNTRRKFF